MYDSDYEQNEDKQVGRRVYCAVELNYIVFVLSDCRMLLLSFRLSRALFTLYIYMMPGTYQVFVTGM